MTLSAQLVLQLYISKLFHLFPLIKNMTFFNNLPCVLKPYPNTQQSYIKMLEFSSPNKFCYSIVSWEMVEVKSDRKAVGFIFNSCIHVYFAIFDGIVSHFILKGNMMKCCEMISMLTNISWSSDHVSVDKKLIDKKILFL